MKVVVQRVSKASVKIEGKITGEIGAGLLVLEGVPREVATQITAEIPIPTIGIGAGPGCDGQILVFDDLVNLTFAPPAKFVRRYADAAQLFRTAIESYRADVEQRAFPADAESYHLPESVRSTLDTADKSIPLRKA